MTNTRRLLVMHPGQHVERDNGGYRDNLINGLVQYLVGPSWLKIIMECFVVVVGFLILAGAVNTSIVGSNGVLNRLAEDGVLTPWFQHPQKRFGTTHRLINLVGVLQLVVIVASLGDVNTLGEAYAFGVIWSFVFMTMSMAVLRFKDRSPARLPGAVQPGREGAGRHAGRADRHHRRVPGPGHDGRHQPADEEDGHHLGRRVHGSRSCSCSSVVERISHRRRGGRHHEHVEQFNEASAETVSPAALGLTHANPVLVAVRNPGSLRMLDRVLHETDTARQDVVVVTCKVLPAADGRRDARRSRRSRTPTGPC